MELVDMRDLGSRAATRVGSSPFRRTNLNDPTQSEQIVVSCSDWVGSFFACSPWVSRGTGFFDSGCYVSLGNSKEFKIREQNVWLRGFEPCWHPLAPFIGCRFWTTLLSDKASGFSVCDGAAAYYKTRYRKQDHVWRLLPMCNPFDIDLPF